VLILIGGDRQPSLSTAIDVTIAESRLEASPPADEATASIPTEIARGRTPASSAT